MCLEQHSLALGLSAGFELLPSTSHVGASDIFSVRHTLYVRRPCASPMTHMPIRALFKRTFPQLAKSCIYINKQQYVDNPG